MFWLRYLLALLFGTAAVYFLAPAAWEKISQRDSAEEEEFDFEEAAPVAAQEPAPRRVARPAAPAKPPRGKPGAPSAKPAATVSSPWTTKTRFGWLRKPFSHSRSPFRSAWPERPMILAISACTSTVSPKSFTSVAPSTMARPSVPTD